MAVRHRDRAATVQLSRQLSSVLPPVRRGEGLCGPVLSTGCSALYTASARRTFREAAGAEQAEQLQRLGVTTIACVPLPVRGDVAGVLTVGRGPGREPLDEESLALFETIAERAGLALESARLHDPAAGGTGPTPAERRARDGARRAVALAGHRRSRPGRRVRHGRGVCSSGRSATSARSCCARTGRRSCDWPPCRAETHGQRAGTGHCSSDGRVAADDSGPLGQVFATGEAVLLPSVDPSEFATIVPAEFGEYMQRYGGGSLAYVPLQIGAGLTGVIAFTRFPTRPDPFTESDLTLLRDLADRVAAAVERARVSGRPAGQRGAVPHVV